MMKAVIALMCLVLVTLSSTQPPSQHPVISETFSSTIRGEVISEKEDERIIFQGKFVRDFQAGKQVTETSYTAKVIPVVHDWNLVRYDMNKTYDMSWEDDNPMGKCHQATISGRGYLPAMWDWVKYAKYNDTEEYEHHEIDIYVYKRDDTEMSLGVLHEDPNTPYIYREVNGNDTTVYFFNMFMPSVEDIHAFDIPPECQSSTFKKPRAQFRLIFYKFF